MFDALLATLLIGATLLLSGGCLYLAYRLVDAPMTGGE